MIKLAHLRDVPKMLEWGKAFHAKTPWSESPLDLELAEAWIEAHLGRSDRVAFVAEDGAIGGLISPKSPFSDKLYVDETFWFAQGRSGIRLLRQLEDWAKARDAVLRLSTLSTSSPDLIDFLERRGYVLVQSTWELSS